MRRLSRPVSFLWKSLSRARDSKPSIRSKRRRLSLRFEVFEDRRLMAVTPTASLAHGLLQVVGTDAAEVLAFKQSAGRLSISGIPGSFAVNQIREIVVDGKGGNDQILLNSEA